MLTGAGLLSAFDKRTPGAEDHLGGILQGSTYIAGISGGLWIIMRNYVNGGKPIVESVKRQIPALKVPVLPGIPDMDVSGVRQKLDSQPVTVTGTRNAASWNDTSLSVPWIRIFFLNPQTKKNDTLDFRMIFKFYKELAFEVRPKRLAGFPISFVDYWGRALVRKILPVHETKGELQFSSPKLLGSNLPFPIICSVERDPEVAENFRNLHIFEFTPYEFGSWDSFLKKFVDVRYLGTKLENGVPTEKSKKTNSSVCVKGYDNVAFVTGTTSSLFNTLILYVHKLLFTLESEPSALVSLLFQMFGVSVLSELKHIQHTEYSVISPNPFYLLAAKGKGRSVTKLKSLYLADGGDDGQNIPFHPLLIPHRKVDVVFALDSTSDLHSFPNGTSLMRTTKRYHAPSSNLTIPVFEVAGETKRVFPVTPTESEFVARNLRSGPVFLGCEMSDYPTLSTPDEQDPAQFELWSNYTPPLIIYTANNDYLFPSNTSTFKGSYSKAEVEGMVENGYNIATLANLTSYMSCVACAVSKRQFDRNKMPLPDFCSGCFSKYCFHQ